MKNHTSRPANLFRSRKSIYLAIAAASQLIAPTQAIAGPEGGKIVGGQGSINQSGLNTRIDQHTNLMAIDWKNFNVGAEERVEFRQPDVSSIALNRVLSHSGSEIHGQIESNGHVILVNPNGVFFGENSRINVGGMIASGLQINSDDFMNGEFTFAAVDGAEGKVVNTGIINAAIGGSVTLIGQQVRNEGLISAKLGTVNLAAGKEAVVTFESNGLVGVKVTKAILQGELGIDAAVINSGEINAEGGQILLTASVSQDIFSQAVNSGGLGEAKSVIMHTDGSFTLGAGADVINTGKLNVSSDVEKAGHIVAIGENVTNTGSLTAGSKYGDGGTIELHSANTTEIRDQGVVSAESISQGKGGDIKILGTKVGIFDQSSVSTSGANGGGAILIGGDKTGANPLVRNAEFVFVDSDVNIAADGLLNGDGGRLITFATDTARIHGHLSVRGGEFSGDGGFVETSGLRSFSITSIPDIAALEGAGGEWLIDPYDLTIVSGIGSTGVSDVSPYTSLAINAEISWSFVNTALQSGHVTIQTGDVEGVDGGDIIFDTDAVFNAGSGSRNLRLIAHRDIRTEGFNLRAEGNNEFNLIFDAGRDIRISGGSVVDTNGGSFTATSLSFNLGDPLVTSSINTGGGDVLINSIGGGDVHIYGSVRTNGGSFTVGDDTARPVNFYSSFDEGVFGTIDTFSSSGYGKINIAVAGNAVLGQLRSTNASGNPTGSKGDVIVLAGNNITLDHEFNFDSSVRHTNDYQDDAPVLSLTAGNNITIKQRIYDASAAQGGQSYYDTLNIRLTAGTESESEGRIDIDAEIYTAGGNFEAAGKIFDSSGFLMNTDNGNAAVNSSSTTGGHIMLNMSDSVKLGELITESSRDDCGGRYCGNLDITSGGAIQGESKLIIHGRTNLNSGSASIVLNNADNQFSEAVSVESAGTVTLLDGSGNLFELDDSNITGALTLTASGGITSVGDVTVGGEAKFSAGSQPIELNSSGNDFSSVIFATTGSVDIQDINDISLASQGALGSLQVYANGAIDDRDDSRSLRVNGLTELSAGTGRDIILDNIGNDFNNVLVVRAGDVFLKDLNSITLGQDGRNFNLSRHLNVEARGDIGQAGNPLVIAGITSLNGRDINLTNAQNDLNRLIISSARSASIADLNKITLDNISLTGAADNSLYVNAVSIEQFEGAVIRNENGGGIDLRANEYITVNNINTSGVLGADSAGGAGGRVYLNAPRLRVGTINTSGGDAASSLPEGIFSGGAAGTIELISQGSGAKDIFLTGDLIAEGGLGSNGVAQPQAAIDVTLQDGGNVQLDHNAFFTSDITISGNGGNDTLYGFDLPSSWTINMQNAGEIEGGAGGTLSFSGIEKILGGDGDDTFQINHNITGGIYGGAGDDTFILNAAQLAADLYGEAGNDSFVVTTMPSSTIQINGGDNGAEGDTLTGPDDSNQWRFTGAASGVLNDLLSFSSIEGVVGGKEDDTFRDVNNYSQDQLIDGADGIDTVLVDNNEVTLDFTGDVRKVFNGVVNAEVIRSQSAQGGTLIVNSAADMVINWLFRNGDADNEGSVSYAVGGGQPIIFRNFAHLIGGSGNDIFEFVGNNTITGSINGGTGFNQVDIKASNRAHQIGFGTTDNEASLHLTNINRVTGNENEGTQLIIAAGENTWDIGSFNADVLLDGVDDGVVTATDFNLEFIDFHTLVGGSGNDHFNFATESPGRITGSVNGGNGSDNKITGRNAGSRWVIDSVNGVGIAEGNTSYLAAASNIQILQGGSGEDVFEVKAGNIRAIFGGEGNDRFELSDDGRATVVDGQEGEDTLVGRDDENLWNIEARSLSNNSFTYVDQFNQMENLVGGSNVDEFLINDTFAGTLNGGAGNDIFKIINDGRATLIIGGAHSTEDTLDLTSATNGRRVAVDDVAEADVRVLGVERLIANSSGNHTLIGRVATANTWQVENENVGQLNSIKFSGFANLTGGNLVDSFIFTNPSANITGIINGAQGLDILDLTAKGDSSVQLLEAGDTAVAESINIMLIEDITAAGTSTLVASNLQSNIWRITDTDVGVLNPTVSGGGIEFRGFKNLTGGIGDDVFQFVDTGSVTGIVDGGAHIEGDSVDVSMADDSNVRLADVTNPGSGFVNIEKYMGNGRTSTLYGSDAGHTWTVLAGTNEVAIGEAQEITFEGFANLQGGSGIDTFNINEGTLTGWIKGGAGNDTFEAGGGTVEGGVSGEAGNDVMTANILAGAVGSIKFFGGEGTDDRLAITGGGANYTALHDASGDDRRLVYTDPAGNAYTVSFETVNRVQDNLTAALLTVNGTSGADTFVLKNNQYNLAGQDIEFTNKRDLTIAASSNDHINIEGQINVGGELTLRNASVTATGTGLINATTLRLDGTAQVGSADNRVRTDVGNLAVTAANGAIYLREQNALNLTELSSNNIVDLMLAGNLTSSTPLIFSRDFYVNTTGGDILLNGENQLTGNLSFVTNGSVNLRNTSATHFGNVQAQNLTVNSTGSINGTGVLTVNGRAEFTTPGSITLTNADNDFNSIVINNALNTSIQDRNQLSLAGAGTSGSVNLSAQNISVNGLVNTGALTLTASEGVTLGNSVTTTDNLVVEAQGAVTQQSDLTSTAGNININAGQFVMNGGTQLSAEAGDINVTAGSDANLRNILARGDINVDAGGSLQINDLIRSIAGDINLVGSGNVNLANNLQADKDITLQSRNGAIQQQAQINTQTGNITLTAAGDISMSSDTTATAATGNITYTGSSIAASSFVAEAGTVTLAATQGAITDNNGDNINVTANRLVADAMTGIGSAGRFETMIGELSLSNNTGLVDLENSRALTINRMHSNGDVVLNNLVGDVTLDNTSGALYDRAQTDARLAGGTVNANYEIGSLTINVATGNLLASREPGPNVANPDIVARTAVLTTPGGSLGSPDRMLVIYVKDHLLIGGARSWGPLWGFDVRPATVDNQSTIQGSLSDLLASGNEQLVEVETLDEVNPAVFTSVRNYFYDDIAILLPRDQLYYDDEEE